jgi:hypothetical protein
VTPGLRDGGKGTGGGFRRARLSSALVVVQIALALVLLNSAGLLMRTFIKMQTASLGLDPERVLFVRVPNGTSLETGEAQQQFLAQALTRLRALPGVEAAASTHRVPAVRRLSGRLRRRRREPRSSSGGRRRADQRRLLSDADHAAAARPDPDGRRRRRAAPCRDRQRAARRAYLKGGDPIGRGCRWRCPGRRPTAPEVSRSSASSPTCKNQGITSPVEPEIFDAGVDGRRATARACWSRPRARRWR